MLPTDRGMESDSKPTWSSNLRPYRPGQSGNPSGRPRGGKGLAARIREKTRDGEELVDLLRRIANGEEKATARDRLTAAGMLFERGFGRPIDIHAEVRVDDETQTYVQTMAADALEQLARALKDEK